MVTNGSRLSIDWLQRMRPHLDWLAFSLDASTDALNFSLGRGERRDLRSGRSSHLDHVRPLWHAAQVPYTQQMKQATCM
ncbi:hypothetical protein WJX72_008002 [[Myrmecia] bisecta]|uniref:Uncharacterized protein n=1 Tax=[Myrmecia] bisecta TaxID=41462 RepID=A0AAW1Q4A2_9CHLO